MKNSYGIYNSEAERIKAKVHTIRDIIEYLKNGPASIGNYMKAPNRKVFQEIFNSTVHSVAGIDVHDLEDLVTIYRINFEASQPGALLPLLDYYKAVNDSNALWSPTSDPMVIYFRWAFPQLAAEKSLTNSSSDLIDSFIRAVTDVASERDPKFGLITQSLNSFLKNEATNPTGCIRDYIQGNLRGFPGNHYATVPGGLLAEFLQEFRITFESKVLPTIDGVSYSRNVLNLLCKTIIQKDWAEVVDKFEEIPNAADALSLIYAECLNFFDYAEKYRTPSPTNKAAINDMWQISNDSLAICLADVIGNSTRDKLENMAWVIFDYVNKYRNIPRDGNIDLFVKSVLDAYDNFISSDEGVEYFNLCKAERVPWDTLGKSVDELDAMNSVQDYANNEPKVRTIINGIGKPTLVPATEASKYEKEGKGSTRKAAVVQTGEKAQRNITDTVNTVKNGVYKPYKVFKGMAGAVDNQLAKITRGLKDAILNTNSAKFREEVIAGKTYSPMKILAKIIGGYAVFCTSKVLFIIGLVTRYYCGKRCKATERRKAIVELEGEIKILDEKIADAQAAGDNKAKYELMRTRNSLNSSRDAIIVSTNKNPDKYRENTKRALFNVEVNNNGSK